MTDQRKAGQRLRLRTGTRMWLFWPCRPQKVKLVWTNTPFTGGSVGLCLVCRYSHFECRKVRNVEAKPCGRTHQIGDLKGRSREQRLRRRNGAICKTGQRL